jgi:UDP-glucose 4-epimerase
MNAIKHGVKHVVLFSSMAVYGSQHTPFYEGMRKEPEDVYAINKTAMEDMTKVLSDVHGFTYTIIRPHNVFGEGQVLYDRFRNVAGIFMNKIMHGEPLEVYGDGEQTRAFSYIEDSLPCFLKVIEHADTLHKETFNIGGILPITVNDLAHVVCAEMGVPNHKVVHYDDRPCEVKHAFTSYEKSVKLLGYKETIGWREGVRRMAAWAKDLGPQEWGTGDPLELVNEKTPIPWR